MGGGDGRNTYDTALANVRMETTFDSKHMRLAQGRGSYVG